MWHQVRIVGRLVAGLLLGLMAINTGLAADVNLTGIWNGEYIYQKGAGRDPVAFRLFLVHDGARLTGGVMERNTFGEGDESWLHAAIVDAEFDADSGNLEFTKRYDGTDGVDHDVEYTGLVADDSQGIDGKWNIPGSWSGGFQVSRDTGTERGLLSDTWSGTYAYPGGYVDENGIAPRPVKFWLVLIDDAASVRGYMIERNTFGDSDTIWLHAIVKGRFAEELHELTFTKLYDGTGDAGHDVEYTGRLSVDGQSTGGVWDIDGFQGTFQMDRGGRHPLDGGSESDDEAVPAQ